MTVKRNGAVEHTGGGFWARFAVLTIVVLWVSLIGGNWIGKYLMSTNKKFSMSADQEYRIMPDQRSRLRGRPPVVDVKPTAVTEDSAALKNTVGAQAGQSDSSRTPSSTMSSVPRESPSPTQVREALPSPITTQDSATPTDALAHPPPVFAPDKSGDAHGLPAQPPPSMTSTPMAAEPRSKAIPATTAAPDKKTDNRVPLPPVPTPERPSQPENLAPAEPPAPTPTGN